MQNYSSDISNKGFCQNYMLFRLLLPVTVGIQRRWPLRIANNTEGNIIWSNILLTCSAGKRKTQIRGEKKWLLAWDSEAAPPSRKHWSTIATNAQGDPDWRNRKERTLVVMCNGAIPTVNFIDWGKPRPTSIRVSSVWRETFKCGDQTKQQWNVLSLMLVIFSDNLGEFNMD